MPDFLLEIGLEEIPARMIDGAEDELRRRLSEVLQRESLYTQTSKSGSSGAPTPEVEAYSTPRRLAVLARGVIEKQADTEEKQMGPAVKAAFKDGKPTVAAIKFAEKVGLAIEKLERVSTAKGEYVAARITRRGRTAEQILAEALPKEINAIYWAKNMYWRAGKPERFVRPVRWMVALLGDEVVPLEYAGVKAQRRSRGHRVLAKTSTQAKSGLEWGTLENVEIKEPTSYAADLKEAGVFARREERYALIRSALDRAVQGIGRWREDRELMNTVVNLTEFPSVIVGNFEREFLALPEEVLVTVMRDHQKYFAVEDASGKLAPHFLAVLNTDGDPTGIIRHGNERVLRARFNDARFFWGVDQKTSLKQRVEMLKSVTFQKDLGSYFDKTLRVQRLASQIGETLKDAGIKVRTGVVHKAALLAKTDLTTELVKEFTELQGIVGGLYAKVQPLDVPAEAQNAIATAIYDHYKPESMEDGVPRTVEGAVLSIADKADTIAGMFALGLIPSGSKDPFALRRQANGIIKTISEHKLPLSLGEIFASALDGYKGSDSAKSFKTPDGKADPAFEWGVTSHAEVIRAVLRDADVLRSLRRDFPVLAKSEKSYFAGVIAGFLLERLEFYLRDARGFAYDVVNAVLAAGADDVVDAVARAQAVAQVRPSEDFEAISAAFKRIKNILRQAGEKGVRIADGFVENDVREDAERALAQEMQRIAPQVRELSQQRNYAGALAEIAAIRPAVDRFFDKVMVMVEDERVRANRLALLQALLNEFSTIADFSEIVTERK